MASLPLVLDEKQDVCQRKGGLTLTTGQEVLLRRGVRVWTQPGQPAHSGVRMVPIETGIILRVLQAALRAALRQLLRRDDGGGEGLGWREIPFAQVLWFALLAARHVGCSAAAFSADHIGEMPG